MNEETQNTTPSLAVGDEKPAATLPSNQSPTAPNVATTTRKKWYKSLWFWLILALMVILAIALGWLLLSNSKRQAERSAIVTEQNAVRDDWRGISLAADTTSRSLNAAKNEADLRAASEDVAVLVSTVKSASFNFDDQNTLSDNHYKDALAALEAYLAKLQTASDMVSSLTEDDLTTLQTLATQANSAVAAFQRQAPYIDQKITTDLFDAVVNIRKVFDAVVAAQKEQEQQAQNEAAQAQKEAQDEKDVRTSATNYMDAYVNGDESALRTTMTTAFQSEFDFGQLSAENRSISRPLSYRITEVRRASGSKYYVYGRLTTEVVDSGEQFTGDQSLTLLYDQEKKDWLVDLDDAPTL